MIEAVIPQFVAALCLLEVTLSLPHEYGYEPECRTVCDTIYKTIYEKSYKNECSTNYVSSCPTSYRTEYRRECSTIYKKSAQEGAVGKFQHSPAPRSQCRWLWKTAIRGQGNPATEYQLRSESKFLIRWQERCVIDTMGRLFDVSISSIVIYVSYECYS